MKRQRQDWPPSAALTPAHLKWEHVPSRPDYDVVVKDDHDPTPPHTHEFDELVVITGGSGLHVIDNEQYPLIRGDAFVIRGEHVHGFRNVEGLRLVNILFSRERFQAIQEQCRNLPGFRALFVLEPQSRHTHRFEAKLHLSPAQLNHVMHLIELLQEELHTHAPGSALIIEALVTVTFVTMCRYYSSADSGSCHALIRISKVIRDLEDHYVQNHSLDAMARSAGMGVRSFRRAFKLATGCAPGVYLLRLRIERAVQLLAQPDANVTNVALDVGFDNSSFFAQQFRKIMGVTPRVHIARQRALQP
ncbi:MAG: AraC family transcriptional regulator [bacterium]|nr:AraC family transcriptional regulator [bacterium]